jgi:predicted RecB family nuclease
MRFSDEQLAFSPTDLNGFLACPHLTALSVAVALGEIPKPYRHNAHADLIRRKGDEHEDRYRAQLEADGRAVTTIAFDDRDWGRAAAETERAIRDEADVVYQAALVHGDWRGFADFILRTPDGYEVVDTKLARHAKPSHVLQLCFYTEQVARIQGHEPRAMHVVTGLGDTETFRPQDFAAYYRRLKERFTRAVAARADTYPYPVEHCGLCDFLALCKKQWADDDHLTLVAGVSRLQVERLEAAGIATLEALARATDEKIPSMRRETLAGLKHQASLQLHRRETGEHKVDLLPLEAGRGFALLPDPSPGDIWLDFEGHPWFDPRHGLEYLTGWIELDEAGEPVYRHLWATDREAEKAAFEEFVDHVVARRARHPDMHVYHYAPYERTALTRLMGEHATREEEIDDLLRGEVLVDLYRVTKQALRASVPSYSLKEVEKLYGFERTADVTGGSESVVDFETWLETGEGSLLDGIRAYNEEDCRATHLLNRWLLGLRPDEIPAPEPSERREPSEETAAENEERDRVRASLLDGAEEGDPRWLLAQLLDYHRREEKPQWWRYFNHLKMDEEELIDHSEGIGGLELAGEPVRLDPPSRSLEYTFRFPQQEHKIGGEGVDPATEKSYAVTVNDERGTVTLCRAANRADEPLPRALIPPSPYVAKEQRQAVLRLAQAQDDHPALVEILERRPPRAVLDRGLEAAALSLDGSYLFVQGPPGSGKTWNGARMAVALMRAGRRVGITSLSHKAIHNFIRGVEKEAARVGFEFRGLQKRGDGDDTAYEGLGFVESVASNGEMHDPDALLLAGTSFMFAREEFAGAVDTIFVDEGGQFALADALAVGTAARNVVVLGDPNQLAQVSQGSHPDGAAASVAGHLLGEDETLRSGMGVFLAETWRMRREVNAFVSEAFYEGRLEPAPVTAGRVVADGAGLRFLPVGHAGHSTSAPEEADAIAAEIERLLGTPYSEDGVPRELRPDDFIVVAPYNAHVRCLRDRIPDTRIEIGTVDKFQGQEATVVFYSMASSSGEDVPRGLEFLFSRNRLNVAVSRARCLAYVVASPRLLEASCRTVEQMRLVNALCRFIEVAEP